MQSETVCSLNNDTTHHSGLTGHTPYFKKLGPHLHNAQVLQYKGAHMIYPSTAYQVAKTLCLHPIPEVLHSRHLEGGVPPGLCGGVGLGVTRRVADYSFWLWGSFIFANGLTPKPVFENWLKLPLNCYWCIVNEMIPTLLIVNIDKEIKSSIVIVNQISTPSYFWHSLGMQQV